MEIFLLLLDELDDAAAAARWLWPRVIGLLTACGVFALSVIAAVRWPVLALAVLALVVLAALVPLLRLRPIPQLRTDP